MTAMSSLKLSSLSPRPVFSVLYLFVWPQCIIVWQDSSTLVTLWFCTLSALHWETVSHHVTLALVLSDWSRALPVLLPFLNTIGDDEPHFPRNILCYV
jgi:hypothetical protein